MDKDAAFLRSVGLPAKDGQPTFDERREIFKEEIRDAILKTLDDVCEKQFSIANIGWTDADLMSLFPVIDSHSIKLFERAQNPKNQITL